MKLLILTAFGLLAALLAGCGGGGGAEAEPETADRGVPARALASPEAFSRFVGAIQPDEQSEAIPLGTLTPPTSETAEPGGG